MSDLIDRLAARAGLTREEFEATLNTQLTEAGYPGGSKPPMPSPQKAIGKDKKKPPEPKGSPQQEVGGGEESSPIEDATDEAANPEPNSYEDPALDHEDPDQIASAKAARDERKRLLPEYVKYYFLEDLPPIDPADPWNQGIQMRFRINQMRYARGEEPVDMGGGEEEAPPEESAPLDVPLNVPPAPTGEPPASPEGQEAPAPVEESPVTPTPPPDPKKPTSQIGPSAP